MYPVLTVMLLTNAKEQAPTGYETITDETGYRTLLSAKRINCSQS
jgi:hypothetical protein